MAAMKGLLFSAISETKTTIVAAIAILISKGRIAAPDKGGQRRSTMTLDAAGVFSVWNTTQ